MYVWIRKKKTHREWMKLANIRKWTSESARGKEIGKKNFSIEFHYTYLFYLFRLINKFKANALHFNGKVLFYLTTMPCHTAAIASETESKCVYRNVRMVWECLAIFYVFLVPIARVMRWIYVCILCACIFTLHGHHIPIIRLYRMK